MLFLGNDRESSIPVFVPPKYSPSRMDYPLLANILGHETTQLPMGLMLIQNKNPNTVMIMQLISKEQVP